MHLTIAHTRIALRQAVLALFATLAAVRFMQAEEVSAEAQPSKPTAWQKAGLQAALKDPATGVQIAAVRFCARKKWITELQYPAEQWLRWLGDPDSVTRGAAVDALEEVEKLGVPLPTEVLQELLAMLKKTEVHDWTKSSVARVLGMAPEKMPPEAPQVLLSLCQEKSSEGYLRKAAAEALFRLGERMPPEAVPVLLGMAAHIDLTTTYFAEEMRRRGEKMPPQLQQGFLAMLQDKSATKHMREVAAHLLGCLGQLNSADVQQALLAVLADKDTDYHLKAEAAIAFGHMGQQLPADVQQGLLSVLSDKDGHEHLRYSSAGALSQLGEKMPLEMQHALLALQKSRLTKHGGRLPGEILCYASDALAWMREKMPAEVRQQELALLQDKSIEDLVKTTALKVLMWLKEDMPPGTAQAALALLQNPHSDKSTRAAAAKLLGECGPKMPKDAVQALLLVLNNEKDDPTVREAAVKALGQLGQQMPVEVQRALLAFLQPERGDFSDIIYALGTLGEKMSAEVRQALIAEFKKPAAYGYSHIAAASVLAQLKQVPAEVPQALLPLIKQNDPVGLSWSAAKIMQKLGENIPPHVQQELLSVMKPENHRLPYLACHVLDVVGITEVSYSSFADALAGTHEYYTDSGTKDYLRCHLYVWSGRHTELLRAVRWLGHPTDTPPLDDVPPQEPLRLIARLWPYTARHEELRHELARRTTQIITGRVKTFPIKEAVRQALQTLSKQFLEDKHPDSVLALQHVATALTADKNVR